MNVRVRGLNSSVECVLVSLLQLLVTKKPEDVRSWQSLNLTLQVQFLALLSTAGLSEEGWLNPICLGSILILHGKPYVICLFSMLVLDHNLVVTSIFI